MCGKVAECRTSARTAQRRVLASRELRERRRAGKNLGLCSRGAGAPRAAGLRAPRAAGLRASACCAPVCRRAPRAARRGVRRAPRERAPAPRRVPRCGPRAGYRAPHTVGRRAPKRSTACARPAGGKEGGGEEKRSATYAPVPGTAPVCVAPAPAIPARGTLRSIKRTHRARVGSVWTGVGGRRGTRTHGLILEIAVSTASPRPERIECAPPLSRPRGV